MFSEEGDRALASAIERFCGEGGKLADELGVELGHDRLNVLQAPSIATASGMRYDEFIGHRDTPLPMEPLPDYLFERGGYDED